jgi:hypothetical protein
VTQPADPTQDQSFSGLDQQAINDSLTGYNTAAAAYSTAGAQYDDAVSKQAAAQGTASQVGADAAVQAAVSSLDNARTQLGSASRAHSALLAKFAVAAQGKARAAADPAQLQLWKDQADKAQSQSDLYKSEADMYDAKTQAAIDTASQRASAALQNASSIASRVSSQNDQAQSAAALSTARAASIPALTQSTVALHTAQIQLAGNRSTQLLSQAGVNDARAAYISGPQADQALARGDLSKAEADQIKALGGAKLGDLVAKGALDDTRAKQIVANMSKWTALPYADTNAPKIGEIQQSTGQIVGVDSPIYKNPQLQPILDRAQAIEGIKNQLASGAFGTGPAAIQYANSLIDGISQQAQLAAQGYTPQTYQAAIQSQSAIGQKTLTDMQGQGNSMASTLMNAASRARTPVAMTPYANAQAMGGGQPALQQAFSLMGQVQPITDRMSAATAAGQYSQISDLFKQAGGAQSGAAANPAAATTPNPATQTPSSAADVAANSTPAAQMAAQAQGASNPLAAALLSGAGGQPAFAQSGRGVQ